MAGPSPRVASSADAGRAITRVASSADANFPNSDPIVLTGSHNWSNNAENNSDENTLIIHDHTTANIYLQEFTKRFNELSTTSFINNLIDININVFPNPSVGEINIESNLEINKIHVYQMV